MQALGARVGEEEGRRPRNGRDLLGSVTRHATPVKSYERVFRASKLGGGPPSPPGTVSWGPRLAVPARGVPGTPSDQSALRLACGFAPTRGSITARCAQIEFSAFGSVVATSRNVVGRAAPAPASNRRRGAGSPSVQPAAMPRSLWCGCLEPCPDGASSASPAGVAGIPLALGPAEKLLGVLTASGRAWRHRLALTCPPAISGRAGGASHAQPRVKFHH